MPRYVALLGSINVGGNQVKMADLKAVFEDNGFTDVATVAASGNVLFDHARQPSAKLEKNLAQIVCERFGIDTFAAVRSKAELQAAMAESPFAGDGEDKLVHVHFLEHQPSAADFAKLSEDHRGRGPERIAPGTRALHVYYVSGVGPSRLTGDYIRRRLGCRGTARNVRSIRRIVAGFG